MATHHGIVITRSIIAATLAVLEPKNTVIRNGRPPQDGGEFISGDPASGAP